MLEWRIGVSKKLEDGVAFLCKSNGVEIINAAATFLSSNSLQLTNGITLEFKKAIIATGSEPSVLPGFEFGNGVLDYKQALMLEYIPKSLAIIGASYVAVEIGTLFAKLGTEVHIIARSDVLRAFDKDAVSVIKRRMQELGITVHAGVTPVSHDNSSVTLSNGEKINADTIVVAIGLSPYTEGLELGNTKVTLDEKGFIKVNSMLQTTDASILAVGDVTGEPLLAHKAMRQGVVAAEVASGANTSYDNIVVPAVMFSDPEMAIAGSVEEGNGIKVTKFPMTAIGRAVALDETKGFVKIAYDSDNVVKGVEIVSADASDMISEAVLAIEMGATLEDIADTIHPHPTYSEALQEVAEAALGRPIHFFYGAQHK
jgi:dihydrolipoamide dehydrogenase